MKKFAFLLLAALCLLACRTKYVPVTEYHEKVVHQHDTTIQRDTLIDHQTTIIREVDSAMLAQYGIRLANAEHAYLVEINRTMREVQQLMQKKIDTLTVHDSIPVVIPVEKPPNFIQRTKTTIANIIIVGLIFIAFVFVIRSIAKDIEKKHNNT